jgi:hypothetical protein
VFVAFNSCKWPNLPAVVSSGTHQLCVLIAYCCRYGIGRFTTAEEVDAAVAQTVSHVNKLREMSPLWEMVQEGIDLKTIQWSQH